MIWNLPLFCSSLIGRDGSYSSVPQSDKPQAALSGVIGVSIFSHARFTSAGAIKKSNYYECVNLSEGKFPII